ncbi:MAG: long-chain-fatty-acid--CoA ligase [Chloroflexi bacterium]|nr:long-chain-fatty-acid--CoA ligase [Chloroflexota bacterium]
MNTAEFLGIASAIAPDKPAMVFEGKRLTYGQVMERVNRMANALAGLGVAKGDRVAILQVNCPEYVEAYFATTKLGAIFVPLNFRSKQDELSYMIANSESKACFAGARYFDLVDAMRPALASVKHFISIEGKRKGMLFYDDLLAKSSPDDVVTDIQDEDLTILMYTAGTTGVPKGVPLTHNMFSVYVLGNVNPADPDTVESNLLTVPLYHVAGAQAMMAAIYGGRTLVMMRQFEVDGWLELATKERVDRAMLVPTMLKRVIDHPNFGKYDLSNMKVITYGAAPMPFEVIKKAIEVMPWVRFINAFGQTETASTITMLGPEDHVIEGTPAEKEKKLKRLASSIGRPMDDVEVAILGESGRPLPPGQVGEIVARGPRVMSGYWKEPEKTKQAFTKDGWLLTGDLGYMDEERYIYLTGRAKDIIIRGGENIASEEVEGVLMQHPAVDEAAVIGVPDDQWGEAVRAVVVMKDGHKVTPEELSEFCRQRLSSFKKPGSVVFVEELPRNPMGKVLKRVLREQYGKP